MISNTLNKTNILGKTHYGLAIYAHILQQEFPQDTIVIHLQGRDCGLCRNPFSQGSRTLKIHIHKQDPTNTLSPETACHQDITGTIPPGNSLLFAENYYHLQGKALLHHINRELHLDLQYNPVFTLYKSPITNAKPYKNITLQQTHKYITSTKALRQTLHLRTLAKKEAAIYKKVHFHYVTFSGTFTLRADDHLIEHSGLLCIDFDHLPNLHQAKQQLLADPQIETQMLFTSPSGDGLKWIIQIDTDLYQQEEYYTAVTNYIHQTYGIQADPSCKNLSRACFLPHDPHAYLNPKYR